LLSYMLGSRYILHDYYIKLIDRYIRCSLSARLHNQLKWQEWKTTQMSTDVASDQWLTATGWNPLHPTRLAFVGIALLALVGSGLAAAYAWRSMSPQWYLVLGFALLWILGATTTYLLHKSFEQSSSS
jgi:hypothetical protein